MSFHMPVIYLDVLIALNIFIDFLLLSATARILRNPYRRSRLVAGALLGGACACLIFIPDSFKLLLFILKIVSAFLIIRVSFRWQSILIYIKQCAVYFISAAMFAGICYAIWFFAAPSGFYVVNGIVYYNVSPLLLTFLIVVSYITISIYDRFTHKKVSLNYDFHLLVDFDCGTANLRALYDTGHHVTDIFTGVPVIIVDFKAVEPYLSKELLTAVKSALSSDGGAFQETAVDTAVKTRLRMIPYRSVNGTGLLPAFRPSHITLLAEQGVTKDITGTFIAVSSVLARGEYQAILGNDIVSLLEGSKIHCKH